MLKYICAMLITIATTQVSANYDISFITVDGKPTLEVTRNGIVCLYSTTDKELSEGADEIVAKAVKKCKLSK